MSRHALDRAGVALGRLAQTVGATSAEAVPPVDGDDLSVAYLQFFDGAGRELDLDDEVVQKAVDTYVPPPPPEDETQLATLRTKAREVAAGTSTFTATQVQKVLAYLVLRATH